MKKGLIKKIVFVLVGGGICAALFLLDKGYPLSKPNIIIVSIDTLRADHLSCYGYLRQTSPYIDEFVKDAVLFENAISQSPKTASSHMSLFTALTPDVHGVSNINEDGSMDKRLDDEIVTLAQVLKEKGYLTVGFHGGGQMSASLGFDKGFDLYSSNPIMHQDSYYQFEELKGIRQWISRSKKKRKPLFLFLHHYICHDPYLAAPKEFRLRFLDNPVAGLPLDPEEIWDKDPGLWSKNFWRNVDMSKAEHNSHIVSLYDGEVYYSDYLFGKVIDILKEEKYYNNSMIILLSDHGEEFYEHKDIGHGKLFIMLSLTG